MSFQPVYYFFPLVKVYSRSRFLVSVHACFFVSESYGNVVQLLWYGIMYGEWNGILEIWNWQQWTHWTHARPLSSATVTRIASTRT